MIGHVDRMANSLKKIIIRGGGVVFKMHNSFKDFIIE